MTRGIIPTAKLLPASFAFFFSSLIGLGFRSLLMWPPGPPRVFSVAKTKKSPWLNYIPLNGWFPKLGDIPKWMEFLMENPFLRWMIWGENPLFFGNISMYLGSKKKSPFITQPGTWILQNALKAFFFSPLRSSRRSSKQDQRSTDCCMCWGAKLGVNPTDRIPAPGTFDENRGDAGGPRQVALGHRFPRAKFQWMKCTFFSRDLQYIDAWFSRPPENQ